MERGVVDEDMCYSRHTPGGDQDVSRGAGVRGLGAGLVYDPYRAALLV